MKKKIGILILTIILTPILAGIYGLIHDQISYSISPEYFTKFKFEQFGFVEYGLEDKRFTVGIIGIWATWWTGLIIGIVNGFTGLIQPSYRIMIKSVLKATFLTFIIAVIFGVIGLIIGKIVLSNTNIDWNFPSDLIDKKSFIAVGTMHNFSYIGGFVGMIIGMIYQIRMKKAIV